MFHQILAILNYQLGEKDINVVCDLSWQYNHLSLAYNRPHQHIANSHALRLSEKQNFSKLGLFQGCEKINKIPHHGSKDRLLSNQGFVVTFEHYK